MSDFGVLNISFKRQCHKGADDWIAITCLKNYSGMRLSKNGGGNGKSWKTYSPGRSLASKIL